jgi:8-oxo-dGTP diphosphatase
MPSPNQFEAYSVILLEHGGRFLLLQRSPAKTFAPNRWTGIGGRVEPEEFGDLRASALRELCEEAGFVLADLENFILRRTLFLARPDGIFIWLLYFTGKLSVQTTPDCPEGTLTWKEPQEFAGLDIIPTSRPVLSLLVADLARDPQGLEGVHAGVGVYDSSENYHHILWDSDENAFHQPTSQ